MSHQCGRVTQLWDWSFYLRGGPNGGRSVLTRPLVSTRCYLSKTELHEADASRLQWSVWCCYPGEELLSVVAALTQWHRKSK